MAKQSKLEFLLKFLLEKTGLDEAGKGMKSLSDVAEAAGQKIKSAFTGLAVTAVAGLTAGVWQLTKAVKEFAGQELGEVSMQAALIQMGQYTEDYEQKILNLANQYQKTTGVGDEMWLKAAGQLTRFGMTSENVDQVFKALSNLTGLMDGNFDGAVMAMQRALEGEFGMFGRLGIQLDLTGDKTTDLSNLMKELAEKGGGSMEARAQTLSGKWITLQNSISDFREEVGRTIAESTGLKDGLGWLAEKFDALSESAKNGKLHTILEGAGTAVQGWAKQIADIVDRIDSVEDLKVVAGVIGDWLKDKLIEGGQKIAAFLAEKAPLIGAAIGKAAWEAMRPGNKDSMTNEQTAAAREAATEGGEHRVYSSKWRENYQNIRKETEAGNQTARLAGEGKALAGTIDISETSLQDLSDKLNAVLDKKENNSAADSAKEEPVLTITGPTGEEISKPLKEFTAELSTQSEAMKAAAEKGEEVATKATEAAEDIQKTNEGAKKSLEDSTKALDSISESNTKVQAALNMATTVAQQTALVAQRTQNDLNALVGLVATIAAHQSRTATELAIVASQVRSMRS